jgi:hypothetical protein
MLESLKSFAGVVATCSEFIAVMVIVVGAAQAIKPSSTQMIWRTVTE